VTPSIPEDQQVEGGSKFFPPTAISLRFCSVCGRDDRVKHLRLEGHRHGMGGKRCPGKVETLRYEFAKEQS
jgi:hypothetical protein